MDLFESVFMIECASDLRRIARASCGEYTEDDARNEAYILAFEIGEQRDKSIDFESAIDRDLVLGALCIKLVKRSDWRLKRAVRIDASDDDEDSTRRVLELPANPSSDPLNSLIAREDMKSIEKALESSFSQLQAYVVIFVRFDNSRSAICSYLLIHDSTLRRRFKRAEEIVRRQASLFDRKKRICNSFKPLPGRLYLKASVPAVESDQQVFTF